MTGAGQPMEGLKNFLFLSNWYVSCGALGRKREAASRPVLSLVDHAQGCWDHIRKRDNRALLRALPVKSNILLFF